MKLGFLMSHHRKNSVRGKVIDKLIYFKRNTLHRVLTVSENESSLGIGCV